MTAANPLNPLPWVALLLRHPAASISQLSDLVVLGTCFPFRQKTHFLTAAHCVHNLAPEEITVFNPTVDHTRQAISIIRHESADIAIVETTQIDNDETNPFWDQVGNFYLGEEFRAYGFPADTFGENPHHVVPRLFTGHYQRFMPYRSFLGYEYLAGELSIPAPGGLSGGPIYRPTAPVMVTGMVTENLRSTTVLDSVEDLLEDGTQYKHLYQQVITYGVSIMLSAVQEWLDEFIPKYVHD